MLMMYTNPGSRISVYSLHDEAEFGNHNPRNLTLLYSGDNLYAAMAFQSEFTYMDVYTTTNEVRSNI